MNPTSFLQDVVAEAVKAQPWYQKNANTVVALIGLVVSVLTVLTALELDMHPAAVVALPVAIQTLTTFAIKLTPNGVQHGAAGKLVPAANRVPLPAVVGPHLDQLTVGLDEIRARIENLVPTVTGHEPTTAVSYVPEVAPWLVEDDTAGRHRLIE